MMRSVAAPDIIEEDDYWYSLIYRRVSCSEDKVLECLEHKNKYCRHVGRQMVYRAERLRCPYPKLKHSTSLQVILSLSFSNKTLTGFARF